MASNGNPLRSIRPRVTVFKNGTHVDGRVILVPDTFEELLQIASQKFSMEVRLIYTAQVRNIDKRLYSSDFISLSLNLTLLQYMQ